MKCPYCDGQDFRRSHQRGLAERVMAWCGKWPYRCRMCRGRFFLPHRNAAPEMAVIDELLALSAALEKRRGPVISPAPRPGVLSRPPL